MQAITSTGIFRQTKKKVAKTSFTGFFVIHIILGVSFPFSECLHSGSEHLRLKLAFFAVDDAMTVGSVKAQTDFTVDTVSYRQLRLIAVMVRMFCADNRI
jgi:hypothetical protein